MDAAKIINLPAEGYLLVASHPGDSASRPTATYRGPTATLDTWLPAARSAFGPKRTRCTLSIEGALATATLTDAGDASTAEGKTDGTEGDVRTPTLTLTLSPFDRPIETLSSPTNFAAIAPARIVSLRTMVESNDQAAIAALTDAAEKAYVRLRIMGITSRQESAYNVSVSRYLPLDATLTEFTFDAIGKIVAWADIVSYLGNAAATYANPDAALKYLPIGMTITIRENQYCEVAKHYQGAYYYPPELYTP